MRIRTKCLLFFLFSLLSNTHYGQSCYDILANAKPSLMTKGHIFTPEQRIKTEEKIVRILSCMESEDSPSELSRIHYALANSYYYLNGEDELVITHLLKAIELDSTNFCEIYNGISNAEDEELMAFLDLHFLDQIEDRRIQYYRTQCQQFKTIESNEQVVTITNRELSAFLINVIEEKDQRIRKQDGLRNTENLDYEGMAILDAQNRISIDSLYSIYGIPSEEEIGKEALSVFWLVMQHSSDCDYNTKWFEIFVEMIACGSISTDHLDNIKGTYNRFFFPSAIPNIQKQGFCTAQDSSATLIYLKRLAKTYPEFFKEREGVLRFEYSKHEEINPLDFCGEDITSKRIFAKSEAIDTVELRSFVKCASSKISIIRDDIVKMQALISLAKYSNILGKDDDAINHITAMVHLDKTKFIEFYQALGQWEGDSIFRPHFLTYYKDYIENEILQE